MGIVISQNTLGNSYGEVIITQRPHRYGGSRPPTINVIIEEFYRSGINSGTGASSDNLNNNSYPSVVLLVERL